MLVRSLYKFINEITNGLYIRRGCIKFQVKEFSKNCLLGKLLLIKKGKQLERDPISFIVPHENVNHFFGLLNRTLTLAVCYHCTFDATFWLMAG